MTGQDLRIRAVMCAAAVVFATVAALLPSAVADASHAELQVGRPAVPLHSRRTEDVRRLQAAEHRRKCTTAHRVAKPWMKEFEANVRAGRLKLPRSVAGFTFTTLPANAAQTYRERGRKRTTTIRFDYRVPNG